MAVAKAYASAKSDISPRTQAFPSLHPRRPAGPSWPYTFTGLGKHVTLQSLRLPELSTEGLNGLGEFCL